MPIDPIMVRIMDFRAWFLEDFPGEITYEPCRPVPFGVISMGKPEAEGKSQGIDIDRGRVPTKLLLCMYARWRESESKFKRSLGREPLYMEYCSCVL
jgi:hypothetical protein